MSAINRWTQQERDYIVKHYPHQSCTRIAAALGRPFSSTSTIIGQMIKSGDLRRKKLTEQDPHDDAYDHTNDRDLVIGEVRYLMSVGHRPHDASQILAGIKVAELSLSNRDWHRLTHRPLNQVCDDFYHYGTP